jgi:hypothetical protein
MQVIETKHVDTIRWEEYNVVDLVIAKLDKREQIEKCEFNRESGRALAQSR